MIKPKGLLVLWGHYCRSLYKRIAPELPDWWPSKPLNTSDMLMNLDSCNYFAVDNTADIRDDEGRFVRSFALMVRRVAVNATVMVTFTDSSYLDAFYASYKLSKLDRFPNFIVVAVDAKAYRELDERFFPVAYYRSSVLSKEGAEQESSYHSREWKEKMVNKIKIIRQAVLIGYNILLFDSDVLFFKDPLPPIMALEKYDLVSQKDTSVCAGFMFDSWNHMMCRFFRPSLASLHFLNLVLKYMRITGLSDQPTIQFLLQFNVQPSLRWTLLPTDLYTNGNLFFKAHQFHWDKISPKQIMVHNNWVTGYHNKIYRLKEMLLYQVKEEYVQVEGNFLQLISVRSGVEKEALSIMVDIANQLNRSFIVPKMACPRYISLQSCNLCGNDPKRCHQDVLKKAKLPWKEHVFFHNIMVPASIRIDAMLFVPLLYITDSECPVPKTRVWYGANCIISSVSVWSVAEM